MPSVDRLDGASWAKPRFKAHWSVFQRSYPHDIHLARFGGTYEVYKGQCSTPKVRLRPQHLHITAIHSVPANMSLQEYPDLECMDSTTIELPATIGEPTPAPSPSTPPPRSSPSTTTETPSPTAQSPTSTAQTPPALRYEVYLTINDLFRDTASPPELFAVCKTLTHAIDVAKDRLFELQPIEFAREEILEDGECEGFVYYCEAELEDQEEGRVDVFYKAKDERVCWVLVKEGKVIVTALSEAGVKKKMDGMVAEGAREEIFKVEKVLLVD